MMNSRPFLAAAPRWLAPPFAFALAYLLVGEGVPDLNLGVTRVYWETFLLPLSLLFGWRGIVGVAVGAPMMHLYHVLSGQEPLEPGFLALQPIVFLAALSLAYYIVRRYPWPEGYLVGTWAITAVITLTLGGYWAVTTGGLTTILELLVVSIIPINIAGPLLLEAGSRWSGGTVARTGRP